MEKCHFLIVTFPAQGHINPTLQFSKSLAKSGVKVTFSTSLSAVQRMEKTECSLPENLTIVPFSDGYDGGWATVDDFSEYYSSIVFIGSQSLEKIIREQESEGHPITHAVYSTMMSWVGELIRSLSIPSTLLWIQPAALFDIYYHYFHGYDKIIAESDETDSVVELPGLPLLNSRDLPSFVLKSSPGIYNFALSALKWHFEILDKDEDRRPTVLVNSFDALEPGPLHAIEKIRFVPVGPLLPSAYLDRRDPLDASFGGDLLQSRSDYGEWLNSKEAESVVYVAFGSYSDIPLKQLEEVAEGLLKSKRPFLWVMRKSPKGETLVEKLSCRKELEKEGVIVEWCSQVEVLSHTSVGCFVSHCGWNSIMESLVCGVPVVGVPQWADQATNAKLIEDVWMTGIRALPSAKDGIVEAQEIRKCLDVVLSGEKMKVNAKKWRDLAVEAAKVGGSSHLNLMGFVKELRDAYTSTCVNNSLLLT
uniref:Glycosyltransferase n=1 Tax=Rubia yunnanensis TaxID=1650721 RepID=A0A896API4_9GENT|nr:glycosyltransferase [Rubia yunnanensis]